MRQLGHTYFDHFGNPLKYCAFKQLVAHAQQRDGPVVSSKMRIFARLFQCYDLCLTPDFWDPMLTEHSGEELS